MPPALQLMSPEALDAEETTPVRWLWEDCLATGMITLLTSRWKAGKTTLISVLLARFGGGGTLAGAAVAPARAVVISEEPPVLWQDRHRRLGFGPGISFSCRPFKGRPTFDQWNNAIVELAADPPDLVVVDPLAMFLPGAVENHAAALLDALEPLHKLTSAGAAVLLVHHPRKGRSANELSPRGTGALTGFADILAELDRPVGSSGSDRRRRLKTVSRLRGTTTKLIELNADGCDYTLLPNPPDREGFEAGWPILKMVLEDSPTRLTRQSILTAWPEDSEKPSRNTLIRWLDRAARDGFLQVHGTGRHHDAFAYSLPE